MRSASEILNDFARFQLEKDAIARKRLEAECAEREKDAEEKKYILMARSRPATVSDYKEWLDGFVLRGGRPTHYYDYCFNGWNFIVVLGKEKIWIPDLCGSNSRNIILQAHTKCRHENIGHNNVYFMADFSQIGGWVPVYKDMIGFLGESNGV